MAPNGSPPRRFSKSPPPLRPHPRRPPAPSHLPPLLPLPSNPPRPRIYPTYSSTDHALLSLLRIQKHSIPNPSFFSKTKSSFNNPYPQPFHKRPHAITAFSAGFFKPHGESHHSTALYHQDLPSSLHSEVTAPPLLSLKSRSGTPSFENQKGRDLQLLNAQAGAVPPPSSCIATRQLQIPT